jgi:curved DNA-binding protein
MPFSELPDYYEVLQVSRAAQPLIVNKAYRVLAAIYHPDNMQTGDADAFQQVVEAYRVLSDPMRRAAYDREKLGGFTNGKHINGKPLFGSLQADRLTDPGERTHDERELRHLILQTAYHTRRSTPGRPGVPLMAIPELFGCSIDEAQFTLWYLRGKKLIETTDDGIAITIAGVDYVEAGESGRASEASDLLSLSPPQNMISGT